MLKTIVDSALVIVGALLIVAWLTVPDAQADDPKASPQACATSSPSRACRPSGWTARLCNA